MAHPSKNPTINYDSFDPDVFDRIPTYQAQMRYLYGLILGQRAEIERLRALVEPPA